MGFQVPNALGRQQRFYAHREATYGTGVPPVSTDAMKVLKSTVTRETERRNRMDARQTASVLERITGMVKVDWSVDAYVVPSGTAGTPPNIHPLLFACMGGYANVPATSDTYVPSDTQSFTSSAGAASCTITREFSGVVAQQLVGAPVEGFKIDLKGGDEPKISFSGWAKNEYTTSASVTTVGNSGGDSTFTVAAADAYNFVPGVSLVSVGTSNNTNAGHLVSAVNTSTGVCTISGSTISGTQASGSVVAPWVPTETTAGSPIAYTLGTLSLDGSSTIPTATIVSAEIQYSNKWKQFTDQAFNATVPDAVRQYREVTGTLTLKARRDAMQHLGRYDLIPGTVRAVVLTAGTTAGQRMVITMNQVEFDKVALDAPEMDESLLKLPFVALGSSGADEIQIAFN